MNGNNMNVRYRRNSYAKKRIKVIAIITAGVLAVLLVLFLIFGGLLKDKVDNDNESDKVGEGTDTVEVGLHTEVPSVNGYGFSLSGATNSLVSERVADISKKNGSNITFVARDAEGKEIYSSSLAQGMGKQSSASSYVEIGAISSRASNRGFSASAVLPVNAFSEKDDLERSVLLAYDAAICAELCRDGADDVLISLGEVEIDEENVDELTRFAENVKAIENEAVVGIALSRKLLESEGSEVIVSKLWENYDFLAFDITGIGDEDDPKTYAEENVNSEVHYYLLRYNMRVLLPELESEMLSEMIAVLSGKGINNWQTVIK